jgi:hypothetical protein
MPALGPLQPTVQCLPEALSLWLRRPGREFYRSPHLVLRLRTRGAIPQSPMRLHGAAVN